MYQPPHFVESRLAVQHALIREHSLGLLITAGPGGLQANYIPFLIDAENSEHGTLHAHLARANPQAQEFDGRHGMPCRVPRTAALHQPFALCDQA